MSRAVRWRWRGSIALVAVALGFALYPLVETSDSVIDSDWPAFATGARMIVDHPTRLYDLGVQRHVQDQVTGGRRLVSLGVQGILPFVSPAWVALLAVPFDALGTDLGGRAWMLFGLLCLAAGLYFAVRPRPPTVVLSAFASVPTALMLLNAQLDGVVALGVGAAIALWSRPYLAGLTLGLTLAKPQLMLPIALALLLSRSWKVIAGWAAAGVLLWAATAVLNPGWLIDWIGVAGVTVQSGKPEVDLAHFSVYAPSGAQAYALTLLTLAAVLATVALAARRRQDLNAAAAILVMGGVVAAPHALPADLVMVAVGLAIWERTTWLEWAALSVVALAAAFSPGPVPAALGVMLAGWLTLRISGLWREPESSPSTAR